MEAGAEPPVEVPLQRRKRMRDFLDKFETEQREALDFIGRELNPAAPKRAATRNKTRGNPKKVPPPRSLIREEDRVTLNGVRQALYEGQYDDQPPQFFTDLFCVFNCVAVDAPTDRVAELARHLRILVSKHSRAGFICQELTQVSCVDPRDVEKVFRIANTLPKHMMELIESEISLRVRGVRHLQTRAASQDGDIRSLRELAYEINRRLTLIEEKGSGES